MIVMQMRSHLSLIICLTSTALSLFFLTLTKSTLGIIIATLIASLIGFASEDWVRKHSKDPKNAWVLKRLFRPAMTRHTVEDRQMLSEKKAQQAAQVEAANDSGEE